MVCYHKQEAKDLLSKHVVVSFTEQLSQEKWIGCYDI